MKALSPNAAAVTVLLALAGCDDKPAPAPVIRPVLSMVVAPQAGRMSGFAGIIEPQVRANLSFRALGRLMARHVNVGDAVTKGALLAALDPLAFELSLRTAQADLSNALAQQANAAATETRQRTLLDQGASTQAQFDLAQQSREAADAAVARARANLAKAREQLSYAELRSDFDGIVTATDVEIGQVVSAGQTVIAVARPEVREAVVDVPEDIAGTLRPGSRFEVALQIDPAIVAAGRVREIAPQADPATRTKRVRITLDDPPAGFRLGTVVTATPVAPADARVELPPSAVLERDGKPMVWVVDEASKTVSLREVRIGRRDARAIVIADGLAPGTRVVTAGVNSLAPGQSVRIAGETPR